MDVIKRTNLQNDDECLTDLLRQWLRRVDPQPTWEAIEKALQSPTVNLSQLATKIVNEKIDPTNDSITEPIKHENFQVECSNAQVQAVMVKSDASFPHIREFQGLDEEEREHLEQRLIMESENIQLSFSTLCNKFFDSLEDIPLKKLIRVLKGLQVLKRVNSSKSASVIQSYEYVLENITDIEGVKDLIEEYSTFFDFRPVEYMIQNVGLERDRQLLEKYKEDFEHYIKRRIFECPCEVGPPEAPNSTKLYVKLESDYDKLIDLKQFQCRLSLILGVSVHVLRLSSVKDGCIQLTFLIPSFIQEAIFPLSPDQERDMKKLGIIKLWCENYCFPNQVSSVIL
ncbi:MAG: hypothetical protein MJE68_28620 [Proteobacteria bacterium]|nr:hypothetical protein [Pseudomonadota bacterium]